MTGQPEDLGDLEDLSFEITKDGLKWTATGKSEDSILGMLSRFFETPLGKITLIAATGWTIREAFKALRQGDDVHEKEAKEKKGKKGNGKKKDKGK